MASKKEVVAGLRKLLADKGIELKIPRAPAVVRFQCSRLWYLGWIDASDQHHTIMCCLVPRQLALIVDFSKIPVTEQEVAALGLLET